MKSELVKNINQAFLQLEFAVKLLSCFERKKIDKADFDADIVIILPKRNLSFPSNTFNSYADLILAAENNFNIMLGFTSIILDSSLEKIGIKKYPDNQINDGKIRTLIYMIRCAFAHDMMHPKWEVRGKFAQPLEIQLPGEVIKVDLSQKHGHNFNIQDIGGHENYFQIKDMICKMIL